jgi:hypothetical protein
MMDDLFRIAREVTDEVMGPGSYAAANEGNPDPLVREQVQISKTDGGVMETMTTCRKCGAFIDPSKGAEPPTGEQTDGTQDDPRAPGDWDDICDQCNYGG